MNTGTIAASVTPPTAQARGAVKLGISSCLDSIRGCADQARKCTEWAVTTRVTIRTRVYTGRLGVEPHTDTDLVLPKRFPVRQPNGREIASSGGRYSEFDAIVEGISPPYVSHGGGGFSVAQLDPTNILPKPCNDTEILYLLDGDLTGTFTLVTLDSSDPTEWSMILKNTRLSP